MSAKAELTALLGQLTESLNGVGGFPIMDASMLVKALTLTLATIEETPKGSQQDDENNEASQLNSRRGANIGGPDSAEFNAMRDRMITLEKSVKTITHNIEGFDDHDLNVPRVDPFEYTRQVQQRLDELEKKLQAESQSKEDFLSQASKSAAEAVAKATEAAEAAKSEIRQVSDDATKQINAAAARASFRAPSFAESANSGDAAEEDDEKKWEEEEEKEDDKGEMSNRELKALNRKTARDRWHKSYTMVRRAIRVRDSIGMIHKERQGKSVFERLKEVEAVSMKNSNTLTRVVAQMNSMEEAMKCLAQNLTGADEKIGLLKSALQPRNEELMTQEGSLSYAAKVQARFDKDKEPEPDINPEDEIAISFRAKRRWKRAFSMITRANRVRRAFSGALRRRAPKGESLLEKLTFLERKVLLDEATQRRKLGELEMSLKNLAMHMQGFDSNLATWKNDNSTSTRTPKTPEQKTMLAAKVVQKSESRPTSRDMSRKELARYRWRKTIRLVIWGARMQSTQGVMSSNLTGRSIIERIQLLERDLSSMLSQKVGTNDTPAMFEGVKVGSDGTMVPLEDSEKLGAENKNKKMKNIQDRLSGRIPSIFDVQNKSELRSKMLADQLDRQQQIVANLKSEMDALFGGENGTFATADALKQALIKRDVEIRRLKENKADKEEMLELILKKADMDQVNPILSKLGDLRDQFTTFSQEQASALEGVVSQMIESYLAQARLPSADKVTTKEDLEIQLNRLTNQITESMEGKADKTAVNIMMQGKADQRSIETKVDQDTLGKIQDFFQSRMDELAQMASKGTSADDLDRLKHEMEREFKREMDAHFEEKGDNDALATVKCIACGQMPQHLPTVVGNYAANKFQLRVRPLDPRIAHRIGRDGMTGYQPPNQGDYVVAGGYHMPNAVAGMKGSSHFGAAIPKFNKSNSQSQKNGGVGVSRQAGELMIGNGPSDRRSVGGSHRPVSKGGIGGGTNRQPTRLMTLDGLSTGSSIKKIPSPRPQMEGEVQQWVETAQKANQATM